MAYGLYVHIPYCKSRCRYCDFYTAGAGSGVPQNYLDALVKSYQQLAPKSTDGKPLPPATIYFGGGTPGLLTPAQVAHLLATFAPAPGAEVTLETNPETTNMEKLKGWLSAGVNRLSVGVQTANNASLKRLGRLHTAQGAATALQLAKQAGFTNISGDIMLALPGYTKAEFDETLALLAQGGASHISAYLLKIEAGTAFGKNPPAGLPTPDEAADFYE
ncbi:coproporphyrinogen III oxidase family protein, partial [Ruminococcaceae bacterium OttesenSCG-928-A16]|nr:coproporphyrinogen III oxidase family protein [Ruminococcaceae bacterium OttesenSCG-928-A16]